MFLTKGLKPPAGVVEEATFANVKCGLVRANTICVSHRGGIAFSIDYDRAVRDSVRRLVTIHQGA